MPVLLGEIHRRLGSRLDSGSHQLGEPFADQEGTLMEMVVSMCRMLSMLSIISAAQLIYQIPTLSGELIVTAMGTSIVWMLLGS